VCGKTRPIAVAVRQLERSFITVIRSEFLHLIASRTVGGVSGHEFGDYGLRRGNRHVTWLAAERQFAVGGASRENYTDRTIDA